MLTDEAKLIVAAQAGSVAAFANLVGRYRVKLLRFLLTRCANFADAEDVLQETLTAAFRYLHSYDSRWRFSTWLYRIAIRNAQKMRSDLVVDLGDEVNDVIDETSNPLTDCIAASETENLWISARRVLNDDVFAALWLRYAEDMSISDVSKALERPDSWTKVNLYRARKALSVELKRESDGAIACG